MLGLFLSSAELPGQRGGGDVAVNEREAPVNGPVIFQAGKGQYLFDIQEVTASGESKDLFEIVPICEVPHRHFPPVALS